MISLPYFDLLLEGRRRGYPAARVFQRFVHWGYWEDPAHADGGAEDFMAAMERLDREVLCAARLEDGQAVLDCGCGFGGTLASINEARRAMTLVGVNVDRRQIEAALSQASPKNGNRLSFLEADACELPFPDQSFDRVLAVECIFHFPSRARFLQEAARVLRPGGRLALSDFVPWKRGPSVLPGLRWLERRISKGYGTLGRGWDEGGYQDLARAAGLAVELDRDITRNTLPTYPILLDLIPRERGGGVMEWPTRLLSWLSRLGLLRYRVLAFVKGSGRTSDGL